MTRQLTPSSKPFDPAIGRASNPILLLVIFVLTAGATVCAGLVFARSELTDVNQADLEQARREAQAAIPRLPADTEDRLATALSPQLPPITDLSDPFVDRAGVTSLSAAGNGSPLTVRTTATNDHQFFSAPSDQPATPALLSRLHSWRQSVKSATAAGQLPPPITTAYLHSELAPAGRIDTDARRGAWFYIPAEKRTLAAIVGAKFYNAVLLDIVPEGVVFRLQNGTTKNVAWEREEDFTTAPATAARNTEQHAQPAPSPGAATTGEEQTSKENSGPRTTRLRPQLKFPTPKVETGSGQFEILQDAVRERYPRRKPVVVNRQNVFSEAKTGRESTRRTLLTFDRAEPGLALRQESYTTPEIATLTERQPLRLPVENAHARFGFAQRAHMSHESSLSPRLVVASYHQDGSDPISVRPLPARVVEVNGSDLQAEDDLNEPMPSPTQTLSPAPSPVNEAMVGPSSEPSPAARPSASDHAPSSFEVPPETKSEAGRQQTRGSLCDPQFRSESITITNESNRPITLLNFVNKLNEAYGANIVLDYDVQEVPVRVNITNAPWTSVLRTLLDLNDLDLVCLDGRIVQIAKRNKIGQMEEGRRKMAPLVREVFKLRYLQPTAGGRVNLAGVTQSSAGATIQSIEEAIRAILKAGGDLRGEPRRVPGRNEIFCRCHPRADGRNSRSDRTG